ncbi:disease resistance-like protein DSC2 [Punica granatum]|nr:disease resistance-like protein DSC2 [Punica granatum]PKI53021.1 hypothetical protein CRG98_026601 [Punica granatum]
MTEQQLIKDIVKVVSGKLKRPSLRAAHHPVGLHYLIERINPLVGIGEDDVRMIGIYGDKEVGKSTLAKALFNHHSHKFEGCSFLEHVKATAGLYGLVKVQETLLRETLGDAYDDSMRLGNSSIGDSVIARRLRFKKVLVVIDDVNALEQLRELAGGKDWFGSGSRIIITTQDRDLLQRYRDVEAEHMYEMERLNLSESRQLLCWNAFKSPVPPQTFAAHVEGMLEVIGEGHPGRLIRTASNLRGKSPEEWDSTIEKLSQAEDGSEGRDKLILNHTVDVLKQLHKAIFLVIACFNGRDKGEVVDIFGHVTESSFNRAIKKLTNRSLISTRRNRIWVNDSLREPSKEMIRAESCTQFQWMRRLDDLVEGSPDEVLQSIKEQARTMCDGFFGDSDDGDSDDGDSDDEEENEDNNEH